MAKKSRTRSKPTSKKTTGPDAVRMVTLRLKQRHIDLLDEAADNIGVSRNALCAMWLDLIAGIENDNLGPLPNLMLERFVSQFIEETSDG